MALNRIQKIILSCILILMLFAAWLGRKPDWPVINFEDTYHTAGEKVIQPVATVELVQSDSAKAGEISDDEVRRMVREAVLNAVGWDSLIQDNQTVVLKPNLVAVATSEIKANGITTDYRVAKAVAELVWEKNPNGKIYVLGGAATTTQEFMDFLGYTDQNFTLSDGTKLIDEFLALEDTTNALMKVTSEHLPDTSLTLYPDSLKPYFKRMKEKDKGLFYVCQLFKDADVLISLPVLKNHSDAIVTGAIKNISMGCPPPSVYSSHTSSSENLRDLIDHSQTPIHQWIHDYFCLRPIDFSVMDGLQGLEYGPVASPVHYGKNMRLILAGKDAVAVDAIASLLMQMDPEKVPYLSSLHNDSCGCADARLIQVRGNWVDKCRKAFTHSTDYAKSAVIAPDKIKPLGSISMDTPSLSGNSLHLSVTPPAGTQKLEIYAGESLLNAIVLSDFNDISLDVSGIPGPIDSITVYAYDQYLNKKPVGQRFSTSGVERPVAIAKSFELHQNYPNPFNGSTTLSYSLSSNQHVELTVYNSLGQEVARLIDSEQNAGIHQIHYSPGPMASGIYIARLKIDSQTQVKRMIYLK